MTEPLTIADRFCGPPRSGNGGYVCGRVAQALPGAVAVRLRAPPPLDTPLRLEVAPGEATLYHDTTLVEQARSTTLSIAPPAPPSLHDAEAAAAHYPGFKRHPFPRCFVCGPDRRPDDGLCIFPGQLPDSTTYAAPWTPHASLADAAGAIAPEFLWAALDCTGGFAVGPRADGMAIVLGELAASIAGPLALGETCVVIGWPDGSDGRRHFAGSAIFAGGTRLVASGRATWIEVPMAGWN